MDKCGIHVIVTFDFKLGHCSAETTLTIHGACRVESTQIQNGPCIVGFKISLAFDVDSQNVPCRDSKSSHDSDEMRTAVNVHLKANSRALAENIEVIHIKV